MKKCNKGMTMIEILVAFVMLTLVMVIMYSSMKFASNLLKEATDLDKKNALFEIAVAEEFKDNTGYDIVTTDSINYVFTGTDSAGNDIADINYSVKKAGVIFEKNDTGYVKTTDDTGSNVRKIYLFSTHD